MLSQRYTIGSSGVRLRSASQNTAPGSAVQRSARVEANFMPTNSSGVPTAQMPVGGLAYNKFFTGISPEGEESLIPYYRDMYYYDSVAGATVDMIGTFPFSDWTLVGLERDDMKVFNENLSRLNFRALMPELSMHYLVDGAFIGSLVYDPRERAFQDILIHDRMSCQISPRPFFSLDPVITVNSANSLQQFLSHNSPYVSAVMSTYPKGFIDAFRAGSVDLDPFTTIFIPRKTTVESTTTSYLKRILPMYYLEKTLYRGTLVEATKRMRATSHVQVGTDSWEPTPAEMQMVLAQFQMAELDPLGAWVVTRQGVQVQDIRTAGDMWKWTDLIDTLIPYKLRALGISEAFLSGDASYSTAEVAMSVFTENMAAYREFLTHRIFRDKLFPLIAVANDMYVDKDAAAKERTLTAVLRNMSNHRNLRIPEIRWHKNLDNHDPSVMEALNSLGDKGIPVPLKMWAAAANVDMGMLLGNLEEDASIREAIEKITGVKPTDSGGLGEGEDQGDFGGSFGEEDASTKKIVAQLRNMASRLDIRSGSTQMGSRTVGLMNRDYGNAADAYDAHLSKSGKTVHAGLNGRAKQQQQNDNIIKAMNALRDPHHRKQVRDRIAAKNGGRFPNLIADMQGRL